MKIKIEQVKNGYIVTVVGSKRDDSVTIHKAMEEFQMLEYIGKVILEKRVDVREH